MCGSRKEDGKPAEWINAELPDATRIAMNDNPFSQGWWDLSTCTVSENMKSRRSSHLCPFFTHHGRKTSKERLE